MDERTLENQPEESVTEEVETQVEEQEKQQEAGDDGLEAILPVLSERQIQELERLQKKAKDFDGLIAKRDRPVPKNKPGLFRDEDVLRVIHKENEKKALKAIVTESDPMFIPELVPDKNFQEVLGYLPRSLDKSSPESIHRGLKLAVKLWKEDKGIKDEEKKENVAAELTTSKGSGSSGKANESKPKERTFLKKQPGIDSWYKSDNA